MTYLTMSMKRFLTTFQLNLEDQTSYCQVKKTKNQNTCQKQNKGHMTEI